MDNESLSYLKNLSDGQLLNMVDGNPDDFTEEAVNAARLEVEARGGIELLYNKIVKELEQVRLENEKQEEQLEKKQLASDTNLANEDQNTIETYKSEYQGHQQNGIISGITKVNNMFSGVRAIKEESILNEWTMILDSAAGNSQTILDEIQSRLRDSKIPGNCTWGIIEVKSSGLLEKVKREFLIIQLEQFKDYNMYVGIRDYGIHLDCCRFLTVEPSFLKKWASNKLTGTADALSAPKNILIHQDLRAWATIVHHAVLDSVNALMDDLGKDTSHIQRGSKGIMEIW